MLSTCWQKFSSVLFNSMTETITIFAIHMLPLNVNKSISTESKKNCRLIWLCKLMTNVIKSLFYRHHKPCFRNINKLLMHLDLQSSVYKNEQNLFSLIICWRRKWWWLWCQTRRIATSERKRETLFK